MHENYITFDMDSESAEFIDKEKSDIMKKFVNSVSKLVFHSLCFLNNEITL